MISRKFFPYLLVSLILISSILPYGIDPAHAQAPPSQSVQISIVGSNINQCSSSSPQCNVNVASGGNEYLYVGASGGAVTVSAADFTQDLHVTDTSSIQSIVIGHSSSNIGTINSGAAYQSMGGIGLTGTPYQTFQFASNGSNTISGSFNLPQDSLVVLLSASSGRVLSPISVSSPFTIDQQVSQGSSLGVVLAHAALAAGSQQFTLTYPTDESPTSSDIGVVLYVFSSSSTSQTGSSASSNTLGSSSSSGLSSTYLSDNFAQDNSLDTSLWRIDGQVGSVVGPSVCGGCTMIQPQTSFSPAGMGVVGVSNTYQVSTIESASSFSTPFTANVHVTGVAAYGNSFFFAVSTSDGSKGIAILGNLNSNNGGYYGINVDTGSGSAGSAWNSQSKLYSSPQVNVPYDVIIGVDATGQATVSVSANGILLGQASYQVGLGSFYIILGQAEGAPYTVGANQAIWQSVQVTDESTSQPTSTSSTPLLHLQPMSGASISTQSCTSQQVPMTISITDSSGNPISSASVNIGGTSYSNGQLCITAGQHQVQANISGYVVETYSVPQSMTCATTVCGGIGDMNTYNIQPPGGTLDIELEQSSALSSSSSTNSGSSQSSVNPAELSISTQAIPNSVSGGNDLVLTISNPSYYDFVMLSSDQITSLLDNLYQQLNNQQITTMSGSFAYFVAVGGQDATSSNVALTADQLTQISSSQLSGLGLESLSLPTSGYTGYSLPTSTLINSQTIGQITLSQFMSECGNSLSSGDATETDTDCINYSEQLVHDATALLVSLPQYEQFEGQPYTANIVLPPCTQEYLGFVCPASSLFIVLTGLQPPQTSSYAINALNAQNAQITYAYYDTNQSPWPQASSSANPVSWSSGSYPVPNESFTLTHYTYSVTFTESGLQPTTHAWWCFWCGSSIPSWSGTLDGNPPSSSTSTSIVFNNVNPGQHAYSVTSPTGYVVSPATGTIQVNGNTNQAIVFSQN